MPVIDFTEIPQANVGGGSQDTFELFARDFLAASGYSIEEDPSRGTDRGKDLLVSETLTGIVQPKKILRELEKITEETNTYLISDEVYDKLIYDGEHYSPKGKHVITVNSFSKTYSMCGMRVGYLYCPNKNFIKKRG